MEVEFNDGYKSSRHLVAKNATWRGLKEKPGSRECMGKLNDQVSNIGLLCLYSSSLVYKLAKSGAALCISRMITY